MCRSAVSFDIGPVLSAVKTKMSSAPWLSLTWTLPDRSGEPMWDSFQILGAMQGRELVNRLVSLLKTIIIVCGSDSRLRCRSLKGSGYKWHFIVNSQLNTLDYLHLSHWFINHILIFTIRILIIYFSGCVGGRYLKLCHIIWIPYKPIRVSYIPSI